MPRVPSSLMTRDTVDPDPVVDGNEWLGRIAMDASCPGGASRLPPARMGREALRCLHQLVLKGVLTAVRRPSGRRLGSLLRTF